MKLMKSLWAACAALCLVACGGGGEASDPGHYAGGSVNGLASGNGVTLTSGDQSITLGTDGTYRFGRFPNGTTYLITAESVQASQVCDVSNGSGTINGTDVTNIAVTCANAYKVTASVSGLPNGATGLVLVLNGSEALPANSNGNHPFALKLKTGQSYSVGIQQAPANVSCQLQGSGSGTMGSTDVNVAVVCASQTGLVNFSVSGLAFGDSMTVRLDSSKFTGNPSADRLVSLNQNGNYGFKRPVDAGADYSVVLATPPLQHVCMVGNPSGTMTPDGAMAQISCTPASGKIGVSVTGLSLPDTIALRLDASGLTGNPPGADRLLQTSTNSNLTFGADVLQGWTYQVSVTNVPSSHRCEIANSSGTFALPGVPQVEVRCSVSVGQLKVRVVGMTTPDSFTLALEQPSPPVGTSETLTITASGDHMFQQLIQTGSNYLVSLRTASSQQICSIANASGVFDPAVMVHVTVNCEPFVYTVGGTATFYYESCVETCGSVTTLPLVVRLNNSSTRTLNGSGVSDGQYIVRPFTFSVALPNGSPYNVTVQQTPTVEWTYCDGECFTETYPQACTVINGTGTMNNANVSNVEVRCTLVNLGVSLMGNFVTVGPSGSARMSKLPRRR
jgi:hypothetical protein